MRLPVFTSLAGYRRDWLRGDLVAGLAVWAVLVPEALAYASIAGASPVVGLYAAPAALVFYAAFGSSRHLVMGPMSATAALSAAAVADLATADSGGFTALTPNPSSRASSSAWRSRSSPASSPSWRASTGAAATSSRGFGTSSRNSATRAAPRSRSASDRWRW